MVSATQILDFNLMSLPSVRAAEYKSLPNLPGIYFVLIDSKVVYIGQARSLHERWLSHVYGYTAIHYNGSIAYWVMPETNEKQRTTVERALIKKHDPILNGGKVRLLALIEGAGL